MSDLAGRAVAIGAAIAAAFGIGLIGAPAAVAAQRSFVDEHHDVQIWSTQNQTDVRAGIDLYSLHVKFTEQALVMRTTHANLTPSNGHDETFFTVDTNPSDAGPEWTLDLFNGDVALRKVDSFFQANHPKPSYERHCGASIKVDVWNEHITGRIPTACLADSVRKAAVYVGVFSKEPYYAIRFDYLLGRREFTPFVSRGDIG